MGRTTSATGDTHSALSIGSVGPARLNPVRYELHALAALEDRRGVVKKHCLIKSLRLLLSDLLHQPLRTASLSRALSPTEGVRGGWDGGPAAAAAEAATIQPRLSTPLTLTRAHRGSGRTGTEGPGLCLMNRQSVNGQVSYSNPLDGSESPRSPSAQSPRSLASLRPKDRLALAEMSLEQMFMAVDPDGSGVVDAEELSGFASLVGVSLCSFGPRSFVVRPSLGPLSLRCSLAMETPAGEPRCGPGSQAAEGQGQRGRP